MGTPETGKHEIDRPSCFVAAALSICSVRTASSPGCSRSSGCAQCVSSASLLLGKLSDMKSTWSSGPASHSQASLSHELWKVPRNTTAPTRPPPGLANPKPSSTWGTSPLGWTSSYSSGKHCHLLLTRVQGIVAALHALGVVAVLSHASYPTPGAWEVKKELECHRLAGHIPHGLCPQKDHSAILGFLPPQPVQGS